MAKLTEKQRRFIQYYESDGTKAAIKAGYAPKSARVTASQLLTNPNIRKAIHKKSELNEKKTIADVTERKEILTEMSRAKDKDTTKAIDILNKMDALYIQKHEIAVTEGKSRKEMLEGAAEELRKAGWKVEPPE